MRKAEGRSKNYGLEIREVGEAGSLRKLCLSGQIVELHLRFEGVHEGKRLRKRRHVERVKELGNRGNYKIRL